MSEWSIRARLGVAHVLLLVASSGLLILLSWRFEEALLRDGIRERADTLVQAVTRTVAFPLAVGDRETLVRQVAGFAATPDVQALEVLDPQGRTLASGGALRRWDAARPTIEWADPGHAGPSSSWRATEAGDIEYRCVHPVILSVPAGGSDERVGIVRMALSSARADATLRRLRRFQVAASLLLVGLAIAAAQVMGRRIARPIERLTVTAEAISRGDATEAMPTGGPAEVGRLSDAFAKMTRALREQTEKVRELAARDVARAQTDWDVTFDAITDMILVQDADGRVVRANRAFQDWARRPDTEGAWLQSLLRPTPAGSEAPSPRTSQEIVVGQTHLAVSRFPVVGEEGHRPASVVVLRDVSERNRLKEHLAQSEKMAALGLLISGVAHEINNPLAGIMGFAELSLKHSLPEAVWGRLVKILELGDRIARLVRNLLNFARPHPPERRSVNLNELVRQCLDLRAYDHSVSRIEVAASLDDSLPEFAADPHQLQQVLMNLVINAEQAMKADGRGGVLRIESSLCADARVALTVEDSGPGIPPEALSRIFDPFFTTKPVGQGTGLGLSLVHAIVREHDGTIVARNRAGGGASFRVEMPLAELPEASSEVSSFLEPPSGRGRRVLIVDDEAYLLEVAAEMLRSGGYTVLTAADVDAALAMIHGHPLDLVLSDLRMPGKDGLDLARTMLDDRETGRVRLCVMTGDLADAMALRSLRDLGLGLLAKPFTRRDLLAFVASQIESCEGSDSPGGAPNVSLQ